MHIYLPTVCIRTPKRDMSSAHEIGLIEHCIQGKIGTPPQTTEKMVRLGHAASGILRSHCEIISFPAHEPVLGHGKANRNYIKTTPSI